MNHPLDGARLKIARAEEHLRALEHEIQVYLDTQPYELIKKWQNGQRAASNRVRVSPPPHLSTVVGDCLYNLRSSLELTFWALALQTGPKDPDRDRVSFPIFANESKFRAAEDGFARYIHPEALEIVEQVQPFRTRSISLSVVRTLSNQDKHGFLSLTLTSVASAGPPSAFVALDNPAVPAGGVDALLRKILQHIGADVLPKFDPLFSPAAAGRRRDP